MTTPSPVDSLVLKVEVVDGRGQYDFPSYKVKDQLFVNKIRVEGLYCRRRPSSDEPLFVTSNCSTHGQGREEVKNVLGVFTPLKGSMALHQHRARDPDFQSEEFRDPDGGGLRVFSDR
jgi:hypothetical protein